MREIKFRVWDKKSNEMSVQTVGPRDWGDYLIDFKNGAVDVAADYCEWLQYTGLKDKNGVEIYEGDIVLGGYDEVYEVRYMGIQNYPAFDVVPDIAADSNGLSYLILESDDGVEVIGNIYENPELLEPSATKPSNTEGDKE